MSKDLNTLLTALYVFIDDHVVTARVGRGRRPELSDSDLITLAVAQALLGFHSERRWIRHLHASPQWRAMFPYLPNQPGYHKRLKAARPLLCQTLMALAAACPSWFDDLWMTDATPVACGTSRETVKRSDLAGHAGYGYCASYSRLPAAAPPPPPEIGDPDTPHTHRACRSWSAWARSPASACSPRT